MSPAAISYLLRGIPREYPLQDKSHRLYSQELLSEKMRILPILAPYAARLHLIDQLPAAPFPPPQLHCAEAVAAVPQLGVAFIAVGGLVVDEEHLVFVAGNLGLQFGGEGGLGHLPQNLRLRLPAVEPGAAARPELAEVEFIVPPLVPELAQQLTAQGDTKDLRVAASNLKGAVGKPLAGAAAHQIAGGEPHPGGGEVPAPVLVGVAVAGLWLNHILLPVEGQGTLVGRLHPLGVPEHLEGVEGTEEPGGPVAHMVGHLLLDINIPGELPGVAHPLRVGRRSLRGHLHMAGHVGLGAGAVPRPQVQGGVQGDGHLTPGEEAVELALFLPPEAHIHHAVGGALPCRPGRRVVPDHHRLRLSQGRITEKVFDVEGLGRPGHFVAGGEGVPPPVVAPLGQGAFEHTVVPGHIAFVHAASPPVTAADSVRNSETASTVCACCAWAEMSAGRSPC